MHQRVDQDPEDSKCEDGKGKGYDFKKCSDRAVH